MSINRITSAALDKILKGEVKEEATCVVKFYSNDCHFCHALADYYRELAEDETFENVHFFAFNIHDDENLQQKLKFNGVPTISVITTDVDLAPKIRVMPDPDPPNNKTWYYANDIKEFIHKEIK
jgi:thiol-disulfide isomerase/thioredoxin